MAKPWAQALEPADLFTATEEPTTAAPEEGVHPVAALFPMMSDEELDALAEDIKANGLQQPLVYDRDGVLIDGRNRQEACRRAGVEPTHTTLPDGVDPVAFILSANIQRRHMSKGQQAMAVARAYSLHKKYEVGGGSGENRKKSDRGVASALSKVSRAHIDHAVAVLRYAEDYADAVLAGDETLNDAYAVALARKHRTDEAQQEDAKLILQRRQQSRYLAQAAPDLAEEVSQERKSLEDAIAELKRREEEERQRREEERKRIHAITDNVAMALETLDVPADGVDARVANFMEADPSLLNYRAEISAKRVRRVMAVLTAWLTKLEELETNG